jgi:hypothetical protein
MPHAVDQKKKNIHKSTSVRMCDLKASLTLTSSFSLSRVQKQQQQQQHTVPSMTFSYSSNAFSELARPFSLIQLAAFIISYSVRLNSKHGWRLQSHHTNEQWSNCKLSWKWALVLHCDGKVNNKSVPVCLINSNAQRGKPDSASAISLEIRYKQLAGSTWAHAKILLEKSSIANYLIFCCSLSTRLQPTDRRHRLCVDFTSHYFHHHPRARERERLTQPHIDN